MEVDKVDIARHHGVEDFPTLVFYKSEIPAVYEGTVQYKKYLVTFRLGK